MIIAEFIEKLQDYPQDTRVVVRGYEGGFDDVGELEEIEIYLNCFMNTWYYGNHEEVSSSNTCIDGKYEKVTAIRILKWNT